MSLPQMGRVWGVVGLLSAVGCGRTAVSPGATAPVRLDSAIAVASFDTAWARIRATYYDTTFRGHDWNLVRATFRPMAAAARSAPELRQAIESLFVRLGDSHFALIPGETADAMRADTSADDRGAGTTGLDFRLVEGRVLVSSVEPGSSAAVSGVHAGWEVEAVGEAAVAALLEARDAITSPRVRRRAELQIPLRLQAASRGPVGSAVRLSLRRPDGRRVAVLLPRHAWRGEVVKYGPLPPQYFSFEHRRITGAEGCVGLVRFSLWMTPLLPRMEQAMEDLAACRGVVIDLRGNAGGVAALVMGVSGFFVDEEVSLGTLTARGTTLRYMVNPRRSNRRGESVRPFAGSVAILVDRLSASTSELFAAGMRDIGRARVFGDTTAGEALPATMARLPNGDLLIHAIADLHSAGGGRIEASGVVPDVAIPVTRRDLLAGHDAALAAALRWAGGSTHQVRSPVTRRLLRP
jgi:carboxyl-terminal processing protease